MEMGAATPNIVSPPAYPAPTLLERALDVVFPPTCVGCRRIGRWICAGCWPGVAWREESRCSSCGRSWPLDPCSHCTGNGSPLDSLTGVTEFIGTSREAVHALKYYGRHGIASTMSRLMAGTVTEFPIDVVSPVPLHPSRRRERGYDQAAMLAAGVARTLDLPFDAGLVRRTRRTQQQVDLDAAARARNVAGAFEAAESLEGETVLLIDDVTTTGATIGAAAESLKSVGAGKVVGLVFACAPRGGIT